MLQSRFGSFVNRGYMLAEGQIIRMLNGTIYRVDSVSPSRAYCIPIRKPKPGATDNATVDPEPGDTPGAINISPNSYVEMIDPANLEAELAGKPKPVVALIKPSTSTNQGRNDMASVAGIPVAGRAESEKARRESLARKRADKHAGLPGTGAKRKLAGAAARAVANKGKKKEVVKTVRACACGCDTETMSYFAPGHDARVHGAIKKLADGRLEPKDYPYQSAIRKLGLTKTSKGYKATNPHFWEE